MNVIFLVPFFVILIGVVFQFILAGIIKFSDPTFGLKKDYTLEPTVTVLISCYNEGRAIYSTIESVSQSDYPAEKFKILVFDDCSTDDSFEWMKRAERDFKGVRVSRNEKNLGKGETIVRGFEQCDSEIVLTIDSDIELDKNAVREMMACFINPKMGLVGGCVGVSNPNENALTAFQVYIYYIFFRITKMPESYFRSVACVSGCMSAIRRSVFQELLPDIKRRNWFGVPVRYGEDRFITHQTLLHGYDTYINLDAWCWTPAPSTIQSYWAQQVRWQRSGLGDFLRTIRYLRQNLNKVSPFAMYAYFFRPLTLILVAVLLVSLPMMGNVPELLALKCFVYITGSFFAILAINTFHKKQRVTINPLRVVFYGAWWLVRNLLMTPFALMTLDSDGWGGLRNQIEEKKGSEV